MASKSQPHRLGLAHQRPTFFQLQIEAGHRLLADSDCRRRLISGGHQAAPSMTGRFSDSRWKAA